MFNATVKYDGYWKSEGEMDLSGAVIIGSTVGRADNGVTNWLKI
jgi:hypothetical protein